MSKYYIVMSSTDHKIEVGDLVKNRTFLNTISDVSYSACMVFRKVGNNRYHYLGIIKHPTDSIVVSKQEIDIDGMVFDFNPKKAQELLFNTSR